MNGVSHMVPSNTKLDAIYCVAGGWTGGNSASDCTHSSICFDFDLT